jgi:hypothetical protein
VGDDRCRCVVAPDQSRHVRRVHAARAARRSDLAGRASARAAAKPIPR